jgi:hypothetical protein
VVQQRNVLRLVVERARTVFTYPSASWFIDQNASEHAISFWLMQTSNGASFGSCFLTDKQAVWRALTPPRIPQPNRELSKRDQKCDVAEVCRFSVHMRRCRSMSQIFKFEGFGVCSWNGSRPINGKLVYRVYPVSCLRRPKAF